MIQAYISIGLKSGMKVQYVRDVVTDSLGKNGAYYGYRGAGYQDLGVTNKKVVSLANLINNTTYYFTLDIDGGGAKEYSITPTRPNSTLYQSPNINSHANEKFRGFDEMYIVKLLNTATNEDGARWVITTKGDIRCQSMAKTQGTSIAITAGTTGNDLLKAINADVQLAKVGDQLVDQSNTAGKIYKDYQTIMSAIIAEKQEDVLANKKVFLEFPESGGDTSTLIRKNTAESLIDTGSIVTNIPIDAITEVAIVEKTLDI